MKHERIVLAEGPRVLLRSPRKSDEAWFLEAMRKSGAFHRPWVHPPRTHDAFASFLARNRADDFDAMLVCLPRRMATLANRLTRVGRGSNKIARP